MAYWKRCYGHNVPLKDCPTLIYCLRRKAFSEFAWWIIHTFC
jgi:hypothetical protein